MLWSRVRLLAALAPTGVCAIAALPAHLAADCKPLGEDPLASAELKLVQVVFRHGARTPLTDKYWEGARWEEGKDCGKAYKAVQLSIRAADGGPPPVSKYDQKQMATVWPGGCKKGELTVSGWQQSTALGQWLRQRYVDHFGFLPSSYTGDVLTGRTTNYSRTRATLQGVITGLYPDTAQPVPVVTSGDADEILIGIGSCKHLSSLIQLQAARLRKEAAEQLAIQQLDQQIRGIMGLKPEERITYTDLYDSLTTLKHHGKGWPRGMTEQIYRQVEAEALRRMAAVVSPYPSDELGPDILSLSVGQLFDQMTERMDDIVSGSSKDKSKIVLLSGHDTTVMPLLVTLIGDRMDRWPTYVANVVIELWQKKDDGNNEDSFFVRALYNQEEILLDGASPGRPLTLQEFKVRHWLPHRLTREDYLDRCKLELRHDRPLQAAVGGGDSVQGL